MTWRTYSRSSADTENIGEQLGRLINPPIVIELRSDLGGGKTTFVRGLAKGLGYSGAVTSPTFTLSREYRAKSGIKLYHFDLYRLTESGVLADQLAEAVAQPKAVVAIEWSDVATDVLPGRRLIVELQPAAGLPDERLITIDYPNQQVDLIQQLRNNLTAIKP